MTKTYAMVCNNRVIEVLYSQDVPPIWPPDPSGNPVTAVECSSEVTRDWSYNPETDELYLPEIPEFIEPEYVEPQPTQLDRIESAINKSHEDIANEAIDNYTLELMEAGVIQ